MSISLATLLTLVALGLPAQNPPWLQPAPAEPVVYPQIVVSAPEAVHLQESGELIPLDVRGSEAFDVGHLPGAIAFHWPESCSEAEPDCWGRHLGELGISGNETLLLYGDATDMEKLGRAFFLLETAGCRDVRVLDGGDDAWIQAGFELSLRHEPRAPRPFLAPAPRATTVDGDELAALFGQRGTEVIDLRDEGTGWLHGYDAPQRFAAGHVPHALPFDFQGLLTEGPRLPQGASARATFLELGPRTGTRIDPRAEILLYGDGATAARTGLAYLLSRMMALPARVLTGGWEGWLAAGWPTVRIVDAFSVQKLLETDNPGLREDRGPAAGLLIDLRENWEFATNHLPGALCLPSLAFGQGDEALASAVAAHQGAAAGFATPLIFYCYGRDCVRSRNAASHAARAGYRDLRWFHGGYPEWRQLELPVFPPPGAPGTRSAMRPGGS